MTIELMCFRAKIAHSHCFVLSKHYPGKRSNGQLEKSMLELNEHIEELKRIYGDFFYASQRTVLSRIKPFRFVPTINGKISTAQVKVK